MRKTLLKMTHVITRVIFQPGVQHMHHACVVAGCTILVFIPPGLLTWLGYSTFTIYSYQICRSIGLKNCVGVKNCRGSETVCL